MMHSSNKTVESPVMKSINILMTPDIEKKLARINSESRSAAVRDATKTVLKAYENGMESIVSEIKSRVESSNPRMRKVHEAQGVLWNKAIVWLPESMAREIERVGDPNEMRISEFLRGVVIFATED